MLTTKQQNDLVECFHAAQQSGHIWPAYAACEGALESAWFTSSLYVRANNIFGTKQHTQPIYGTLSLPTKEFLNGQWVSINANWVSYPNLAASFTDRMNTLRRLAPSYPHYAAALSATTGEEYVTQVSLSWSTGPSRGADALAIYNAHKNLLQ